MPLPLDPRISVSAPANWARGNVWFFLLAHQSRRAVTFSTFFSRSSEPGRDFDGCMSYCAPAEQEQNDPDLKTMSRKWIRVLGLDR